MVANGKPVMGELTEPLLLFDGVCNLCIWSVRFIVERDPEARFRFLSLQSERGRSFARRCGLEPDVLDTFVLVEGDRCYTQSDAALRVAGRLAGAWPLLSIFRLVPRALRDPVYRFIARNRYRWFGRREQCMVPTPALKERFL